MALDIKHELPRTVRRLVLRRIADQTLRRVVKLPRRIRRFGARGYANAADALLHGTVPGHGKYRKLVLNEMVLQSVFERARQVML